jgi:hypothetical protein
VVRATRACGPVTLLEQDFDYLCFDRSNE